MDEALIYLLKRRHTDIKKMHIFNFLSYMHIHVRVLNMFKMYSLVPSVKSLISL